MWSEHPDPRAAERAAGRSPSPFTEFDLVVLTVDRPELGLRAGDVGTVLSVVGSRYHVEFAAPGGGHAGVLSEPASSLRPLGPDEVFHVRTLDRPGRLPLAR